MTLRIDFGKVERKLLQHATTGLINAANYALKRAQDHAPVRKLNRLTKYKTGRVGFRQPKLRQLIVPSRGGASETDRIRGHANASEPFIQVRKSGVTVTFAGDFRRVEEYTKGGKIQQRLQKIKPEVFATVGGKTRRQDPATVTERRLDSIETGRIKAVNAAGRYEIRSGRANFRSPDGETRVGGRLKGELHTQGPIKGRDGAIWMYVRSATKDQRTGRLYPRDQEFGTSHHPPHPFLRPGLHESRTQLRRMTRAAIVRGLRKG